MGHRDIKRVSLDFDWPLNKVWDGYLVPSGTKPCENCDGTGRKEHPVKLQTEDGVCWWCDGSGRQDRYVGPPEGPGWQLWETTSEGSPTSPVFETPEALARWATDNATVFASMKATYAEWYQMITGGTLDVDSLGAIVGDAPMTFFGRVREPER
jgi:hypothetical protein